MRLNSNRLKLGLSIGIPSLVQGSIGIESEIEKKDISVLSLMGEVIEPYPNEPKTITRPIIGCITGFSSNDIEKDKLVIEVDIKTDQWYPQGKASVEPNGTWAIDHAFFGAVDNLVRVGLYDKKRKKLATFFFIVTVKRKEEKTNGS